MERFKQCTSSFDAAASRAKEMIKLHDALKLINAGNLVCDDALRSSWIQIVSSFDFYMHEIIAVEAIFRLKNGIPTQRIHLPMESTIIQDDDERYSAIDTHLRNCNSYKSFVAPDKLAEAISCFTTCPWDKIASEFQKNNNEEKTKKELKTTLNNIWSRRNQIVHEADINPTLSGIDLWPMFKEDVVFTMEFVVKLAKCLPTTISQPL